MLQPKFDILNIIVDAVMEERVADVCIVPMTINYEKVLEGDTFPEELLGEEKVEESLLRVIKAAKLLRVNYGRVYI
jgi:glycerol-3-phosphate O-acyltransferase